ncbi:MAG: deoxyribonuclease IV [Limisphaerales bacterium]
MSEPLLGAHMSIAGGVFNAFFHGKSVGCNTIQIFVKSNNQWRAKPLSDEEVEKHHQLQKETGINPVVAHDSYLINAASQDKVLYAKSREALKIELERCQVLKIPYLVMHPGSHVGAGEKVGLVTIARALNEIFDELDDKGTKIALETTAGQGSNLGYKFEHLADIMGQVKQQNRMAVCLDTCHVFAAGYDLRTADGYKTVMAEFDRIVGLKHLAAIHCNDSKKGFGSRVDRHEHIGKGELGKEAFGFFLNDSRLEQVPKILETPKGPDYAEDKMNLKVLRSLIKK